MKYSIIILLVEFMILVDCDVNLLKFLPNLPLGKYRLNFVAIHQCNQKSFFKHNYFLFKTSRTTVELRGNISIIDRAFDDTLMFRLSMAKKDNIGSWQNNAYVYHSPQAYSTLKKLLGGEFPIFLKQFGINSTIPNSIPPGLYTSVGYDISNFPSNTNLPKQLFYGTYKYDINYTEQNGNIAGCPMFVVEVNRPWEI